MATKPKRVLSFKIFEQILAVETSGFFINKNTTNTKGISTPITNVIKYQIP